jgi:hypothetical protein
LIVVVSPDSDVDVGTTFVVTVSSVGLFVENGDSVDGSGPGSSVMTPICTVVVSIGSTVVLATVASVISPICCVVRNGSVENVTDFPVMASVVADCLVVTIFSVGTGFPVDEPKSIELINLSVGVLVGDLVEALSPTEVGVSVVVLLTDTGNSVGRTKPAVVFFVDTGNSVGRVNLVDLTSFFVDNGNSVGRGNLVDLSVFFVDIGNSVGSEDLVVSITSAVVTGNSVGKLNLVVFFIGRSVEISSSFVVTLSVPGSLVVVSCSSVDIFTVLISSVKSSFVVASTGGLVSKIVVVGLDVVSSILSVVTPSVGNFVEAGASVDKICSVVLMGVSVVFD